jgi:hypothetical protein
MAEVINATTRQRHDEIFKVYCEVLKERGDQASNVSKKSLYEEVARRTGYSWARVSTVITQNFRRKGHGSR